MGTGIVINISSLPLLARAARRPSERAIGAEPGWAGNGCAGLFSATEINSALHREAK